jgi:hypothetical protein
MTKPPDLAELEARHRAADDREGRGGQGQDYERPRSSATRPSSCARRRRRSRRVARRAEGDRRRRHGRRRGHRRGRREDDRHPADSAWRRRRPSACSSSRRRAAQEGHQPGRGDQGGRQGRPPPALGLKDPNRPMGSFIFVGPSGVGKTLLAKALAEFMFGDEDALIHLDMSEYMEKHNVSPGRRASRLRRLRGGRPAHRADPPPPLLGRPARRDREGPPRRVQHAAPDHGGGPLTDSFGRHVDFRNVILIMTSNIGADLIKGGGRVRLPARDSDGVQPTRR